MDMLHPASPQCDGDRASAADYDVLVVGGGINGTGIARDAAGRGMSVALCEKDDLGAHTSSASSKLIHGGLRYLEHFEFGLVRKALIEREVLLRSAPHVMRPLSFVLPHDKGQRPAWMIRAGLFLYDHLARRELLHGSRAIDLRRHAAGLPLRPEFHKGFIYSDAWVDDARLVVLNAIDAADKGATVMTRTRCESIARCGRHWAATLRTAKGAMLKISARCVVNASGPWADRFLRDAANLHPERTVRLVKGSHIVVKRLYEHPHAYLFQHPDGRVVFAIPYESDFTLIGTTDIEYRGDPDQVRITEDEIAYLSELCARYFRKAVARSDVVWSYSGVRPLLDDAASDASAVTRDYRLELDDEGAPALSVFGGKITTYRKLAEEAVNLIGAALGRRHAAWTANACLPGGDLFGLRPANRSVIEFDRFVRAMQQQYSWLAPKLVERYARAYGTLCSRLLFGRKRLSDMGPEIEPGLFGAEVEYWIRHEWACNAEDMLWRRSKLGLHLGADAVGRVDRWIDGGGCVHFSDSLADGSKP
ncbi:MAG: glycerol-3-phosphate dehydrogenase [Noviherbaspirillum sp.]|nr:glycerol-3-phosphate dehydrogenase [Noviherbaspirillum sp.]